MIPRQTFSWGVTEMSCDVKARDQKKLEWRLFGTFESAWKFRNNSGESSLNLLFQFISPNIYGLENDLVRLGAIE